MLAGVRLRKLRTVRDKTFDNFSVTAQILEEAIMVKFNELQNYE